MSSETSSTRDHVRCPDCGGCATCAVHSSRVICEGTLKSRLLDLHRDIQQLMAAYRDDGRDIIAAMPFAASLDQLFMEKYGVNIP